MGNETRALVIESHNAASGATAALERLLTRLREQSLALSSLDELVITHQGLGADDERRLARAAGVAPRFVHLPDGADYYAAKNLGFAATRAALVAFGDVDCWPDHRWLEELFAPFADPRVRVVAGRTTYRTDLAGIAASTIDFMYFEPRRPGRVTRNFYANNVAFRRGVLEAGAFPPAPAMYRGSCQLLGMDLLRRGVEVTFAPAARTVHRFPDTTRELLRLRLLRGGDTNVITPHLAGTYLPRRLRFLGRLGRASALAVLAARLGFSVRALNRQDLPTVRGLRRAAATALIAGLSLVDVAGAIARPRGGGSRVRLSYDRDRDRLQ